MIRFKSGKWWYFGSCPANDYMSSYSSSSNDGMSVGSCFALRVYLWQLWNQFQSGVHGKEGSMVMILRYGELV